MDKIIASAGHGAEKDDIAGITISLDRLLKNY